jgi:23S rRNA pseudouridine1911/1915/1917 synthase
MSMDRVDEREPDDQPEILTESEIAVVPGEPVEFEIRPRMDGKRIDAYLATRFTDYSRTVLGKVIEAGAALVHGRQVKPSYRLRPGDVVKVWLPELISHDVAVPEDIPITVVYEDENLTVVNKPANMVTHPARGNWRGTLVNAIQFHYDSLSTIAGEHRPGIVHRLDRDTTGLLVVAKNDIAHRKLGLQFEYREVRKEYLALVYGMPQRDRDYIERPIGFHPTVREKMAIRTEQDGGKHAMTYYEVIERFDGYAFVRCKPQTGRTHQIRVHLHHIGHPILADKAYSGRDRVMIGDLSGRKSLDQELAAAESTTPSPDDLLIDRQALHAHRLSFRHPITEREVELTAPLPPDMARTLEALRAHRPAGSTPERIPGSRR